MKGEGHGAFLRAAGAVAAVIASFLLSMTAALAGTAYVRAGKLIDVERGTVLSDQLITIVDERIEAVGPFAGAPADGPLIDWSAYTVLPGLIDMHAHVVGAVQSGIADPLMTSGAEDVLIGAKNARDTLLAGFTTIRDVGAVSPGHYADMIAVKGDPLTDISILSDVQGVMKGGVVVKAP